MRKCIAEETLVTHHFAAPPFLSLRLTGTRHPTPHAMPGYSSRPLVEKLGIKPDTRIAIISPPRGYRATLGKLPRGVTVATAARGVFPFIQFFTTRRAALEARLAPLKRALAPAGALWVSWPKKASGVSTDLTEDVVRAVAVAGGLVDVKVCAVDEVWSGLKLVRRLKDR
jgi:hypothetical protein